jgi:hypothetical protein
MTAELERFRSLVEPWLGPWSCLIVNAVGVHRMGQHCTLSAAAIVTPKGWKEFLPRSFDNRVLWGATQMFDSAQFDAFLTSAGRGVLHLGDFEGILEYEPTQQLSISFDPGYYRSGLPTSGPREPSLWFTGMSRAVLIGAVLGGIDIEAYLRAQNPPFTGVPDLYSYFSVPAGGDSCSIQISARPPVRFDSASSLGQGHLRVAVALASTADKSLVSAGYHAVDRSGAVSRGFMPSDAFTWTHSEDVHFGEAVAVANDCSKVTCFLTYGDMSVEELRLTDSDRLLNYRHAIHRAFDPEDTVLRQLLFTPSRTESRLFEDGVAMLLAIAGFSVTQKGRTKKLAEAPDILAIPPSQKCVAVVECTIDQPDTKDKVAKVLQRAEAIRRKLAAANWTNIEVLAIVATPLTEKEVAVHRKQASSHDVIVMASEQLQDLLLRSRMGNFQTEGFLSELVGRLHLSKAGLE